MIDIPELTRDQLDRASPTNVRRRWIDGRFEYGEDVTALRRFVGLAQKRFAAVLGISVNMLRNW